MLFIGRKNGTLTARQQSYNDVYIGHALSSCLLACGIEAWLGTFGVAALMSCTSQSVFCCCILRNFAFAGRCVTPPPPLWTMGACPASCLD